MATAAIIPQSAGTGNTPPSLADRLPALLPAMERAIRAAVPGLAPSDLEDGLQEAVLQILTHPDQDRLTAATDSYLIQAAVFTARAWAGKQRRYAVRVVPATDHPAARPGADDLLDHADQRLIATAILDQLSGTTRTIAAGVMAGLRKGEACTAAGVTKQNFGYHRRKIAAAVLATA